MAHASREATLITAPPEAPSRFRCRCSIPRAGEISSPAACSHTRQGIGFDPRSLALFALLALLIACGGSNGRPLPTPTPTPQPAVDRIAFSRNGDLYAIGAD